MFGQKEAQPRNDSVFLGARESPQRTRGDQIVADLHGGATEIAVESSATPSE